MRSFSLVVPSQNHSRYRINSLTAHIDPITRAEITSMKQPTPASKSAHATVHRIILILTRGFMYAGTPRVVVSLWTVSDQGTTDLMVRFYQGTLKDGMRPAAALRAAQIPLMKD